VTLVARPDHLAGAVCGGRPQLNNRPSVRTTAKAANAAVRRKSNLSMFGSIGSEAAARLLIDIDLACRPIR